MRGRSGRQQAVGAQVGDCPSALPAVASVTSKHPTRRVDSTELAHIFYIVSKTLGRYIVQCIVSMSRTYWVQNRDIFGDPKMGGGAKYKLAH